MEELLLEAAGGEAADTSGLRLPGDAVTGTVTGGSPEISTTTFTPDRLAPTPATHKVLVSTRQGKRLPDHTATQQVCRQQRL